MANLSPHKSFPGRAGAEVRAEVTVSRPIPRRDVPLEGTKTMILSAEPLNITMGGEEKKSWIFDQTLGLFSIGILLLPFTVITLTYLWVLVSAVYETLLGMLD